MRELVIFFLGGLTGYLQRDNIREVVAKDEPTALPLPEAPVLPTSEQGPPNE